MAVATVVGMEMATVEAITAAATAATIREMTMETVSENDYCQY